MKMESCRAASAEFDVEKERYQKAVSLCGPFQGTKKFEAKLGAANFSLPEKEKIWKAFHLLESSPLVNRPENYMAHPVRVASYCLEWGKDVSPDEVTLALIHNILEVTAIPFEELLDHFGIWVARGCETLAVDRKTLKEDSNYLTRYYERLCQSDPGVQRVKIFDKLDNLLVLFINPDDAVRAGYLKEVEVWLLPIVVRQTPSLMPAFERLVQDSRRLGHRPLAKFLNPFSEFF